MATFKVNQEVCIGCGTCIGACPDCFEFDDNGKSAVKAEGNGGCEPKEIIDNCPVKAISWVE